MINISPTFLFVTLPECRFPSVCPPYFHTPMATKQEAQAELQKLVDRFREQYHSYKQSTYSEALVRRDFIDPFFRLLGWDMDNSQGYA